MAGLYGKTNVAGADVNLTASNPYAKSLNTPAAPKMATPTGSPTGFWGRIASVGVGKWTVARAAYDTGSFAKDTAVGTSKAFVGSAASLANAGLRHTGSGKADTYLRQRFGLNPVQGALSQMGKTSAPGVPYSNKYIASHSSEAQKLSQFIGTPNVRQTIGNAAQTGLLVLPFAKGAVTAGKAGIDLGGKFLLEKLGTQGVKNLAGKAGVDFIEGNLGATADAVAKSQVGKEAVKALAPTAKSFLRRTVTSSLHGAAGMGTFSAAGALSENQSNKQALKAGVKGAITGGILGAGGSVFKTAATKTLDRYRSQLTSSDVKGLQEASKTHVAAEKMANKRGLPQGETQTKLAPGKPVKGLPMGNIRRIEAGKPREAEALTKTTGYAKQAGNEGKVKELTIKHVQGVNRLSKEFDQVMHSVSKSDHAVTKEKVDGYNSTRQLQEDYGKHLKSIEDQARGGQIQKTEEGYKKTTEHSAFYSNTFAEKGRAPTVREYQDQALKELKSGKAGFGMSDTYHKLRSQAAKEIDQRYSQRLEDMNNQHEASVKEAKNPTEKGFTVTKAPTKAEAKVNKRVAQIDKIMEAARNKGTKQTPEQLRALMRERKSLLNPKKEATKVTPTKEVTAKEKLVKPAETPEPAPAKTESPITEAVKKAEQLRENLPEPEKAKSGLGESGAVNPGAASEDVQKRVKAIQDHLAETKKAATFSGNIARDFQAHEATNKIRLKLSTKLLKDLKNVPVEDKKAVWNYREAKAAGTELPTLTNNQHALNDSITQITEGTLKNKQEMVKLKAPGYNKNILAAADSGNHRIALGKGAGLEKFVHKFTKTPISARSLRTSTSSSKARVYYAVTDEAGNRSLVAIKNVSVKQGLRKVAKGKFVNVIDSEGNGTGIGKITPKELKNGEFTAKDGTVYKVSQATSDEITRATGQGYVKDPLVSALIDYHETKNALESAKMLEHWKTTPEFKDIAVKYGSGMPPNAKWKTTKLPQMSGYLFDPKVANVLDDIYGNFKDRAIVVSYINHAMRNMMVAVPVRHNLNELGFYFTDRGVSSLINPMAYKRGTASLVKAFNEVMNQGDLYKAVAGHGFNFMYKEDHAFDSQVMAHTKQILFEDQAAAERVANDIGTTVANMRNTFSTYMHKAVWVQQDVLNLARIIERTQQGKGMSLEQAVRQTERFNPQYRVPSEVAGSRVGSQILRNNNLLFFGSYHYDQWKALSNMVADAAGKNGGKAALQAVDKFAAISLGVYLTHALVDKGLQQFSGNKAAYTKPFGVLDLPDQLYQLATGEKDISTVVQSQIFPAAAISTIAQTMYNRDFFTGKNIRDTNLPREQQVAQLASWLAAQQPFLQQFTNSKKSGNVFGGAASSLIGARFPTNTPATNKLYSMKYDTLPNVQSTAKKQAQAGDIKAAQATISQYDKILLESAKQARRENGQPVPSEQELIKVLKKNQYYYSPKQSTIVKWSHERPKSIVGQL